MAKNLLEQLDALHLTLFQLEDIDKQLCLMLQSRFTALTDQVPILRRLALISNLVKQGANLPIQRINYKIKKFFEVCKSRWENLLKLSCETLIFFMIAFNGLGSLPDKEFTWLVQTIQSYVEMRAFPSHYILRDQIRKVASKTPRKVNIKPILAKYNTEGMKWCETPAVSATEIDSIHPVIEGETDPNNKSIRSREAASGDGAEISWQRQTSVRREYRSSNN